MTLKFIVLVKSKMINIKTFYLTKNFINNNEI